ncbi:MAG: carbamoyl-phosphate synthase large subunit [Rhodobacteraceae bacterium]|nr:carbamoyl-phosphate synthase large subunit [Paracoccaceae bacterium]
MISRLLIANRGEIAVRIARTASDMGIETLAVYTEDDAASLHIRRATGAARLPGKGAAGYLDAEALLSAARAAGCDAVHPGYGFLSENVAFARAVEQAGLIFVGPDPEALALFGDKIAARQLALDCGVPVLAGSDGAVDLAGAEAFFDALPSGGAMIVKAVAGGGGRGMQVITERADIAPALTRCAAEAEAAFGSSDLYVERYLAQARHIEVQVIGDGQGIVLALGDRDCSLQRRHQKVLEIAPAPALSDARHEALAAHALAMARAGGLRSLGTFEFLLDTASGEVFFIEANPRLQVEHTVTEEILGLDLVEAQLRIASGATLAELALNTVPRGVALQCRVTLERIGSDGRMQPGGGQLSVYEPPLGAGIRVDGFASAGYTTLAAFDSLLAKVVVRGPDLPRTLRRAQRALAEFRIEGCDTNIGWLRALLDLADPGTGTVTTGFIAQNAGALAKAAAVHAPMPQAARTDDPDRAILRAPMSATLLAFHVTPGERVVRGQPVAVLEAMKMQHHVEAECTGIVLELLAEPGRTLGEGTPLMAFEPGGDDGTMRHETARPDPASIRPDLQELQDRLALGRDENRAKAVARRHARGQQTARENLALLCDAGTFSEYGELAVAAQSLRRSPEDLRQSTSGDGILTGTGLVNADRFGDKAAATAFAICDYTVLAGTQGVRHHHKLDRILGIAANTRLPLILFAEGGGGRPGDTDTDSAAGLHLPTFARAASLSGKVPMIGVAAGRCFAGNAALLGVCDVIIATEDSNIGMAGPAMIEGGGLGRFAPEDIGPIKVQWANGVVDIRVSDEAAACASARSYLSYFQGALPAWQAPDQRLLRHAIPENRLRVYPMREVIETLADTGSVMELRAGFAPGMITALIRIEGRPFGLFANNPGHLGGAIDGDAADKAVRFMNLCNRFGLPLIALCDTPGFMVGPEAEQTALVRRVCQMFVAGAALTVPVFGVVLRKGYGLGAMAMLGGGFHQAQIALAWPSGEFGGMGLEGAVRLGFRKELDAIEDPREQAAFFEARLAEYYARGKAVAYAEAVEIDAVIDPAETRSRIINSLRVFGA